MVGAGCDLYLSSMSSWSFLCCFFLEVIYAGTHPDQLLRPMCVTPQFNIPCVNDYPYSFFLKKDQEFFKFYF